MEHRPSTTRPERSLSELSPMPSLYGATLQRICNSFLAHYCHLEVRGTVPSEGGQFLICSNHRSHLDSIAIMMATGLSFNSCGLLAAHDYFFRNPIWLNVLTPALQLIPVNRRPRAHEFDRMIRTCQSFFREGGRAIIAYPEGTRTSSATVSNFKRGAGVLAIKLAVPILPVFVSGTAHILPKGRVMPRPGRIVVHLGSLMHIDKSLPDHKLLSRQVAKEIESRVRALSVQD